MFGDPSPCSIKALVLDKALNEAHMNHMELQQELAKHESNPSEKRRPYNLQDKR